MHDFINLETLFNIIDFLWHWRFWACMAPAGALAYISYLILGLTTIGWIFIIGFLVIGFIAGILWDWFYWSEESIFYGR